MSLSALRPCLSFLLFLGSFSSSFCQEENQPDTSPKWVVGPILFSDLSLVRGETDYRFLPAVYGERRLKKLALRVAGERYVTRDSTSSLHMRDGYDSEFTRSELIVRAGIKRSWQVLSSLRPYLSMDIGHALTLQEGNYHGGITGNAHVQYNYRIDKIGLIPAAGLELIYGTRFSMVFESRLLLWHAMIKHHTLDLNTSSHHRHRYNNTEFRWQKFGSFMLLYHF